MRLPKHIGPAQLTDFLGDANDSNVAHGQRFCETLQASNVQARGYARVSTSFVLPSMSDFDPNKLTAEEEAAAAEAKAAAAKEPQLVTFSPGDWFLGPGDGSVGRGSEEHPAPGTLKGSLSMDENMEVKGPPESAETKAAEKARIAALNEKAQGADLKGLPKEGMGYDGELQLVQTHRSSNLLYSDLTDSSRFTCLMGPNGSWMPGGKPEPEKVEGGTHPQFEFQEPHHKVHVHLVDKSAGPFGHVLWDGVYDMGGTEVLKAYTKAEGGDKPEMELICPPYHGPPHWYELTVSAEPANGMKPRMMENFIGSQVIESYRPDQDPELSAFDIDLDLKHAYSSCSIM